MAEDLVPLPPVSRLSPRVIRILGHNPGKFTLQGTNTYLITGPDPHGGEEEAVCDGAASGSSPTHAHAHAPTPAILLDAAEGVQAHLDALQQVLTGQNAEAGRKRRHVTDIVLTHWHHDHTAGLSALLTLLHELRTSTAAPGPAPRIHKFLNPNADEDGDILSSCHAAPRGSYTPHAASSSPLHPLADNDVLTVGGHTTLRALHTPGHTADHASFLLLQERLFFSGDNVLGQGTSVFEDLRAYMASLGRSLSVMQRAGPTPTHAGAAGNQREADADADAEENTILPAHGPAIEAGRSAVRTYMSHRLEREAQVLALLAERQPSASAPPTTVMHLVQTLYAAYPEGLYPAAARGLFLHLHKLAREGKVECLGQGAAEGGGPPPVKPLRAEYMELGWRLRGEEGAAPAADKGEGEGEGEGGGEAVETGTGTGTGTGKL